MRQNYEFIFKIRDNLTNLTLLKNTFTLHAFSAKKHFLPIFQNFVHHFFLALFEMYQKFKTLILNGGHFEKRPYFNIYKVYKY